MPTRTVFLAASILAIVSVAEARQSTLSMSCGQANALVRSQGAVVLSTGRHTYDRFVASPGFCSLGEYADRGLAPTASGQCRLAFVCKPGRPPWREDRLFLDGF